MIETTINNRNNESSLVVEWPSKKPEAVLIIAHGASEHIYRYKKFATFLQENNISVIGYNHIGHAEKKSNDAGGVYFGAENGDKILVSDFEDVCLAAYQKYPDLPLYVLGHSMGSLIVRAFMSQTKLAIDGAIICGTLHPASNVIKSGKAFAKFMYRIFGKDKYSKQLNKMVFGSNLGNTLSHNSENVANYKQDPDCGNLFSNKAVYDLINLMDTALNENNIKHLQPTKYLVISGAEDPFSKKTKETDIFTAILEKFDIDYQYKIYPEMKHEILQETNKEAVFNDILNFIKKGEI